MDQNEGYPVAAFSGYKVRDTRNYSRTTISGQENKKRMTHPMSTKSAIKDTPKVFKALKLTGTSGQTAEEHHRGRIRKTGELSDDGESAAETFFLFSFLF